MHEMNVFENFVDYPPVYLTLMHMTCLYSIPLFMAAVYCITTSSPKKLASFLWFLLMHNCISFMSDIVLSAGITPVLYIPVLGGYPCGFLKLFGVPSISMLPTAFLLQLSTMLSVVLLFYLRYDAILLEHHRMKGKRPYVLFIFGLIQLITMVTTPILVHFITPDQDVAKKSLIEVCLLIRSTYWIVVQETGTVVIKRALQPEKMN
ncbi:7TM chemoreceptor [Ancylostoma caninum]|uniref:7TM chemoreceptor n=1 Tax=Ancylostoma caninum TaxID=29170 RepID=A0A368H949_ANCCA|nr:7TM chemoreceptor [Ancylostoma caninum]